MIYPLLPLFIGTLGAGPAALGVIEGAAESVAALLKLLSGRWSDTLERRSPLVRAGYGISTVARPLVAFAMSPLGVLLVRVADRIGKGLRSAPRDALIADATDAAHRGRAFGFHRAMDHAGAVLGPLLAWALLSNGVLTRDVFLWAAVPGAFALLVLVVAVREAPRAPRVAAQADRPPMPRAFKQYLVALVLFALGNSSDAFLLLRASELGVSAAQIPLLWALHHVVKASFGTWGGARADRLGRRRAVMAAWSVYVVTYLAFAAATNVWHAWALFVLYGMFFALVEGAEKAYVADLVPAEARGAAYGWFNLALGIAALPASVGFGLLWERFGARAAFGAGAACGVMATVVLVAGARGASNRGDA